jgi:uncharacterized protein (TIGR00725 family)
MALPVVAVMGPGEGATRQDVEIAWELGRQIGQAGWVLLTGGRNQGVMDAASYGARSAGGLTVGVLPGSDRRNLSAAVDIPIVTGMGNARNAINILSGDVVVACGMGTGTASEVALALKANKPVILLNCDDEARAFFQKLGGKQVFVATDVAMAIAHISQLLQVD